MNTIQIKNGITIPLSSQLANFELGYVRGGSLYINNDGKIVQLADPRVANIIDSDNYLQLPKVDQAVFKSDKFLIIDGENKIYYRTAKQVLSDLGAFSASGGTIDGDVLIKEGLFLKGKIVLIKGVHYGDTDPNDAKIPGEEGQIYFVLSKEGEM